MTRYGLWPLTLVEAEVLLATVYNSHHNVPLTLDSPAGHCKAHLAAENV